jgi:hypothetical protein
LDAENRRNPDQALILITIRERLGDGWRKLMGPSKHPG